MTTPASEEYLRTLYELQQEYDTITTGRVASTLQVRLASATNMLKRLAAEGMVEYSPYSEVNLTVAGAAIACRVLYNRHLVERYLIEILALSPAAATEIADDWEHLLSPYVAERMQALLALD